MDCCNVLYSDSPGCQKDRLQKVQNQAARIVSNSSFDQSSFEIFKPLHWLPVRARVMFKILVLVFRIDQGTASETWDLCLFVFKDGIV